MAMKMFLIRPCYDKFNQPLSRDAQYQEHPNNTCNFTGNESYDKNISFYCPKMNRYVALTKNQTKPNSVVLIREWTIPTERPPLVGKVSANFCG
jgi:hypothetical protein